MRKIKKLIPQSVKNIYHYIVASIAVLIYKYPAKKLTVIGITGTDGKTTTSTILYHVLKKSGKKVALISTVAAYIGNKEIDIGFHVTSPDPMNLQKLIKKIADKNYKFLVLEVTSHGLDQHRLLGTNITIGVLTNITNEHLDYHKSYNNYLRTKVKLFVNTTLAILNKDDRSYKTVRKLIKQNVKIKSYSKNTLTGKLKKSVDKKFVTGYDRLNATAAILVAQNLGLGEDQIINAISNYPGVKGRMQEIKNNRGMKIIVDFAHTPNALESILKELVKIKKNNKLIVVFGCASERDEKKRPVMASIATTIADASIFTAEDPRFEDINKIIEEMVSGVNKKQVSELSVINLSSFSDSKKHVFIREPDRGKAINVAINKIAKRGDIVVICGKGHEKSMSYKGIEYPWSDQKAVKMAFKERELKINYSQ